MNKVKIKYIGKEVSIEHLETGNIINTSRPKEYGGAGTNFSSTDLLIAALGNCIITTIDSIVQREKGNLEDMSIYLDKELTLNPKELKSISMEINIPLQFEQKLEKKLEKAIESCPVYKCLSKGTIIKHNLNWQK